MTEAEKGSQFGETAKTFRFQGNEVQKLKFKVQLRPKLRTRNLIKCLCNELGARALQ